MQEKPFLFDCFVFGVSIQSSTSVGTGSVEGVRYERRNGAENECGEVEDAGRENFGFTRRESVVGKNRKQRVDVEVLERVSSFVEFEA